jgi:hypothetical protein
MLTEAGFIEPAFHGRTDYFTSPYTQGGLITARKPGGEAAAGVMGTADGVVTVTGPEAALHGQRHADR